MTEGIKHINKKNQEYIAEGNRMTEEIIIDGVNVAECEHHLSTGYCQLQMIFQGMVFKLPFGKHLECNLCIKDCYYKQLKRLEQENNTICYNLHLAEKERDELKEALAKKIIIPDYVKINEQINELKQENKELKEKFKQVFNIDNQECWNIAFLNDEKYKYRSALEEIRDSILNGQSVCTNCIQIAKKINEVLNEGK